MPEYKSQEEKAASTINAQPKDMHRTIIHQILERDVAGWKMKDIALDVQLTQSRLSVITRSPMYDAMRRARLKELGREVQEKVSTHIADVESVLSEAKLEAAETMIDLMRNAKSDAVRATISEHIVDRGKEKKDGTTVVVQITERIADRFEKVFKYDDSTRASSNESRAVGDSSKEVS